MSGFTPDDPQTRAYAEAEKRVRKIKRFYKDLASWAGTSIFLIALNLFLSGNVSWAKYPVFFWGIAILLQSFEIIRLQKMDKAWEERQLRKFTGRDALPPQQEPLPDVKPTEPLVDYSGELLQKQEREMEDLSEYRKLQKPWKEEDLV